MSFMQVNISGERGSEVRRARQYWVEVLNQVHETRATQLESCRSWVELAGRVFTTDQRLSRQQIYSLRSRRGRDRR